jgi:hypothetical protein
MNERIPGLAFDRSRAGIDRRSFLRLAAVAGAAGPLSRRVSSAWPGVRRPRRVAR